MQNIKEITKRIYNVYSQLYREVVELSPAIHQGIVNTDGQFESCDDSQVDQPTSDDNREL